MEKKFYTFILRFLLFIFLLLGRNNWQTHFIGAIAYYGLWFQKFQSMVSSVCKVDTSWQKRLANESCSTFCICKVDTGRRVSAEKTRKHIQLPRSQLHNLYRHPQTSVLYIGPTNLSLFQYNQAIMVLPGFSSKTSCVHGGWVFQW